MWGFPLKSLEAAISAEYSSASDYWSYVIWFCWTTASATELVAQFMVLLLTFKNLHCLGPNSEPKGSLKGLSAVIIYYLRLAHSSERTFLQLPLLYPTLDRWAKPSWQWCKKCRTSYGGIWELPLPQNIFVLVLCLGNGLFDHSASVAAPRLKIVCQCFYCFVL